MITSLGEMGADLCASRALFVLYVLGFVVFSLHLGVGGWLQYVTVAFPGHFYYHLCRYKPKVFVCVSST